MTPHPPVPFEIFLACESIADYAATTLRAGQPYTAEREAELERRAEVMCALIDRWTTGATSH